MSAYDFNPDVCLQVFHGIAEEIPSGVRRNDLQAVFEEIVYTQELLSYIRTTTTLVTKGAIDWMWNRYNIPDKLKRLGELKEKSPKEDAWRPTTGKVNLNSIVVSKLVNRKLELIKQIEMMREKSAVIIPYLKTFSEDANQQLEVIDAIEKKYQQQLN